MPIAFPKSLNTILNSMQDADHYQTLIDIMHSRIISLANGVSVANNEGNIKYTSASTAKLLPVSFKLVYALFSATTMSKQDNNDSTMEIVDENKQEEESMHRNQHQ